MFSQFLLENFHFATSIFAALAFFSIFWLYLDAWQERRTFKEGLKITGFLLISLSFLAHAVLIESPGLTSVNLGGDLSEKISLILRNLGYLFLLAGLISDPLIDKPKLAAVAIFNIAIPHLTAPILAVTAAWLYLRRATIGLEDHTKNVSYAFFLTAFFELLCIPDLFSKSTNIDIFHLVAPLGPIWIAAHLVLLLGSAILIKWAFFYLLKRINTQLFIIFTTTTLAIFLLTTVSFTFLLLKNISEETLARLSTDVSVLSYALDAKKSETLASASILAQNSNIITAIGSSDKKILAPAAESILISQKLSSLIIANEYGQVLARGEDRERVGDSLSGDSLFKRAMIGESISSISTTDSAISPIVAVRSATPIKLDGKVIGVIFSSQTLDNNFLDGIQKATGLEIGLYGGETLSATTINDTKNLSRPIGIKNTNKNISNLVLLQGKNYSGQINLLNTSYFAAYHPLKDSNNETVGMIFAGRPSASIFATAGKSIEITFLITVILIIFSFLPSYLIARYISSQLK